jgi:REP element-mobilizing transposase RayT
MPARSLARSALCRWTREIGRGGGSSDAGPIACAIGSLSLDARDRAWGRIERCRPDRLRDRLFVVGRARSGVGGLRGPALQPWTFTIGTLSFVIVFEVMVGYFEFAMKEPLAYFFTWTTYGAWIPGDLRGSVDSSHNEYGAPYLSAAIRRVRVNRMRMTSPPFVLSISQRSIVEVTIKDHCRFKKWPLVALNVRSNHVHCVVQGVDVRPEIAMGQLKAWSTRRLREAGVNADQRIWTREGSTRYLFTEDSIERAADYVLNRQ